MILVIRLLFEPIKPMLLTLHAEAFDDSDFLFEPKYDGWRILLHKDGDRIEAFTRHGTCVTHRFPELQTVSPFIHAKQAILDGEGVVFRDGRPVFDDFALRGRLTDPRKIQAAMMTHPVTFVAFDVLYADCDCTQETLIERKVRLGSILQTSDQILATFYEDGRGRALKALTEERRWEGIVAKRKDSRYRLDTRSTDWLKIKNWQEVDAVVLGYRLAPQFGMVVGLHFNTVRNKPVATVEFGFTPDEKTAFLQVAAQLHTVKQNGIQWLEPKLCCRIRYLERTERHQLRMGTFQRFVFDRKPEDCVWVS